MEPLVQVNKVLLIALFTALTILVVYAVIFFYKVNRSVTYLTKDINKTIDSIKPIVVNTAIIIDELNIITEQVKLSSKGIVKSVKNGIFLTKDIANTVNTIKTVSTGNIKDIIRLGVNLNKRYKLKKEAVKEY